jgi:lysozyme
MRLNNAGLEIIKQFEGYSSTVYSCPAGRPTIGWGSCWDSKGDPITLSHPRITRDEATAYLDKEVAHVERAVARLVPPPLTANQFSATCSLAYNIGTGRFQGSQIRQLLLRRNYQGAADIWWQFRRANGIILRGLVLRREKERQLFLA